MTLQAADNPISFFDIAGEFGYPTDNKLGNYRNTTSHPGWDLGNLPLDTGIPTSGPIKFSDFYSKQLNVGINCWDVSDTGTNYHVNAKTEWNNNNLAIVGDTNATKKQAGSKVIIHVNKEIGSVANNDYSDNKEVKRGKCALRTGSNWNEDVSMQIDFGDSAKLRGAGGDKGGSNARKGGDGGDAEGAAQAGANGEGSAGESNGGAAGGDGSVLRSYGASNTYTLNNSGTMTGTTKNNCDTAQIS